MKKTLLLSFLGLSLMLAACGDDESVAREAAYEAEILEKRQEWLDYKTTINNSYTMVYVESGFVLNADQQQTSVVENGQAKKETNDQGQLNQGQGVLTMDQLYESVHRLFGNDSCELDSVVFEDQRPIILSYKYLCGEESYTLTVQSFTPASN